MYKDVKVIAVVPSRKGSKRLPGKNWREFCGKPLVAWTIEQALACDYIDEVMVSTDDEKVVEIGEKYCCRIHYRQPEDAVDHVNLMQVIPKVIKEDCIVVLLQPTSPLRTVGDIEQAFLFYKEGWSVVSVCKYNPYTVMLNGAIYITSIHILDKHRDFFNPVYVLMPKSRSIDIDDIDDWNMAEAIFDKAKRD